MHGLRKKIKGMFPVTVANAVYIDGTSKTLGDAMNEGVLGNIGKSPTIKDDIYVDAKVWVTSSQRASHDCTVIGTDIMSCNKAEGNWGSIYYVDIESGTSTGTAKHKFVESNDSGLQMKSVDYKYDKLIVGNGRAGYDPDFGRMYIFYEADTWKAMTDTITFENCGAYKEIDVTDLGVKTYAFWGNCEDVVFISCNLFNDVYRIQLGRGQNEFDNGTFEEEEDPGRYNGTWKILNHWHQDGILGQWAAHGGQYYGGHLYLATNNLDLCVVYKCILRNDGRLEFQPLNFDVRNPEGDQMYKYIDGMCIHNGKMYTQPLNRFGTNYGGRMFLVTNVPV